MRKYIKYTKSVLAVTLSVFALSSCSEDKMDEINGNTNNPLSVDAKFVVTDLGTATAFSSVGGDFSLYASVYMEQEAGVHNQMYNAETRKAEPTATTTYNNVWGSAYTNIRNAKVVIKKCTESPDEIGNNITLGIGKVFLAYNAAILTDLFGDVPYFQSGELNADGLPVYRQPKVDKQDVIYADILKQLNEAIPLFLLGDEGIKGEVGEKDLVYGGDGESWIKAAYALKARYTMRLLNRSTDKTTDLDSIIQYINLSFASADEEFKFKSYDGNDNVNPLAGFSYSREALAASQSLFDKFAERNDPRALQILLNAEGKRRTSLAGANLAPNGTVTEQQNVYDYLATDFAWDAPTQLLSYHELLFLKAEAYARLGNIVEAEKALKAAITAGFANTGNSIVSAGLKTNLSPEVSATYYTANVKALFDANPLKEIMIQKYLAFVGASGESVETYNDYRRMKAAGEDFITLENPLNASKFPLRFTYGNSDVLANPNITGLVGDGTYVYKENVWWAGGSR